jgi:RHS repeat-associated protein
LLNLEGLEVKTPEQQTPLQLTNAYGKEQELKERSRTDTANSTSKSKTETFTYDDELRLTEVETEGILFNDKEAFTLDAVGNRTEYSESGNPWQYDENNRLTKIGEGNCGSADTICYDYDAAGNRIKKTEGNKQSHYRYDTQNRLIEVNAITNGTEQLIARYGYDLFNRRIWKEQHGDRAGQALTQAKRTYFFYSDEGLLAEEEQDITLNGDGSITANTQPTLIAQYGPKPDSEFTVGMLFIKTKDSNGQDIIAYYHHDHLNTPIQATDKQGNVVWSANFNAFGRVSITTSTATVDKPTITSNLRFPGQYEDEETGLHYNWNRYYGPEEGRYIMADPIKLKGGFNIYAYAEGNPLGTIDPKGLEPTPGGPYHPPENVKLKCKESDLCPQLVAKMYVLMRMISSHQGWDWHNPPPRGGGRHSAEISDLWRAYANCQAIWESKKCEIPPPLLVPPPADPEPSKCGDNSCTETAAQVVVGAGVVYVIYRCVRMVPSLIPPLWPTIPANAAIP